MARWRKEERRMGSASRGMVRRLGRFFPRVRHWGVPDRERVSDRCHVSWAAVDVCSDTPAWAQRAERAVDGGVVDVSRALSGAPRARELLRSGLLDVTPIISATACHQRNYVERYSRFKTPVSKDTRKPCPEQKGHYLLAGAHACLKQLLRNLSRKDFGPRRG